MENSNKHLWFGLGGIVVGLILALLFNQPSNFRMMVDRGDFADRASGVDREIDRNDHMHSTMQGMMMGLDGLQGDQFDEAFIDQMIIHHEGAIVMAESALKYSNRQEIKNLANAIISAQTKEIEQMKSWRNEWFK